MKLLSQPLFQTGRQNLHTRFCFLYVPAVATVRVIYQIIKAVIDMLPFNGEEAIIATGRRQTK